MKKSFLVSKFCLVLLFLFDEHHIIHAQNAIDAKRFDVMAKYIYVQQTFIGDASSWFKKGYVEHMRLLGVGKDISDETLTHSLDAFLQSVGEDKTKLLKLFANDENGLSCSADFLKKRAVECKFVYSQKYFLDCMALYYCMTKKNTYIALLFPCVDWEKNIARAKEIMNSFGTIVYEKEIYCSGHGPFNLVRVAYDGASWIGNYLNHFKGAQRNIKKRFINMRTDHSFTVKVMLFECNDLSTVRICKEAVRAIFGIGPYPIHINDTYQETMTMAQTVFNEKSIRFLNETDLVRNDRFESLFATYKKWLSDAHVDKNEFCLLDTVNGSIVTNKKSTSLQFISHATMAVPSAMIKRKTLLCVNTKGSFSRQEYRDDIIFNPEKHFYYKNVKFSKELQ